MSIIPAYDCTHGNLQATLAAVGKKGTLFFGYATGSGDVPWTTADVAQVTNVTGVNPVLYDQDPNDSNYAASLLDVEANAGTIAKAGQWYKQAYTNYVNGKFPGQRHPGFYTSAGNVTNLVNGLIAQGVTSGPGLLIANWNLSELQAIAGVITASGPFPIIGIQFSDPGPFDMNVISSAWANAMSVAPTTVTPQPPIVKPPSIPPTTITLLGIVSYIQENYKANWSDFVSKRVTSADGETWHTVH